MAAPREAKVFEVSVDADIQSIPFILKFKRGRWDNGQWQVGRWDGHNWTTDNAIEEHRFEAVGDVGAGGLLAFTALIRYDDKGTQVADLSAFMRFFRRVLPPADYQRLADLLDRQDIAIPLDPDLTGVFTWLLEEYAGRPTRPSTPSSNGQSATGQHSTAPASWPAATSSTFPSPVSSP